MSISLSICIFRRWKSLILLSISCIWFSRPITGANILDSGTRLGGIDNLVRTSVGCAGLLRTGAVDAADIKLEKTGTVDVDAARTVDAVTVGIADVIAVGIAGAVTVGAIDKVVAGTVKATSVGIVDVIVVATADVVTV